MTVPVNLLTGQDFNSTCQLGSVVQSSKELLTVQLQHTYQRY